MGSLGPVETPWRKRARPMRTYLSRLVQKVEEYSFDLVGMVKLAREVSKLFERDDAQSRPWRRDVIYGLIIRISVRYSIFIHLA